MGRPPYARKELVPTPSTKIPDKTRSNPSSESIKRRFHEDSNKIRNEMVNYQIYLRQKARRWTMPLLRRLQAQDLVLRDTEGNEEDVQLGFRSITSSSRSGRRIKAERESGHCPVRLIRPKRSQQAVLTSCLLESPAPCAGIGPARVSTISSEPDRLRWFDQDAAHTEPVLG